MSKTGVGTRKYNKLSSEKIAKFAIDYSRHGNGSQAVNKAYNNAYSPEVASIKANRMLKNDSVKHALNYVKNQIDNGAVIAVDKIISLVDSDTDSISLRASEYLVNQSIGTATQKTENKNININIDTVLG